MATYRYIGTTFGSNTKKKKKKRYLIKHVLFHICDIFSVCYPDINCEKDKIKQGE